MKKLYLIPKGILYSIVMLLNLLCVEVVAQSQVTGKITSSEDNSVIPGVNVVVKGTLQGTVTDSEGNYSLEVPDGEAILAFSSVGYIKKEVIVGNQTVINVSMLSDVKALDEIVVIGYGSVKKTDLTGSVSSVKSEEINAFPQANALQALSGRSAGVQVKQNNGAPGASISVRIRGTNSIQGSNEPLYVIDGFPITSSSPNILNNSDIQSIEILKDAAATAIYGSRGANGVVLITTKSGKMEQTKVDFEASYGIQKLRNKLDMMNAKEYATFYNEVAQNDGWTPYFSQADIEALGEGFDWQDYVFQDAPVQNYNLTVSGGNEKTQFATSLSVFDQEGIIRNSGYNRYSFRTNLNHDISDKIGISSNIVLSKITQNNQNSSGGGRGTSLISGALYSFPTVTPFNDDGTIRDLRLIYPYSPEIVNPVYYINETTDIDKSNQVLANFAFTYKPFADLTIRILGGIENNDARTDYYETSRYYRQTSGNAQIYSGYLTSLLSENTITYAKTIGKHDITAVAGFTYQDFRSTPLSASGSGFLSDIQETYDLAAASNPGIPNSAYSYSVLLSYLGRINYTYNNKYLFSLNFRSDGSSKYSEGNKWGYFPSGAIAWRISEENFLREVQWLSDLKLRASWGKTGSQAIAAYSTQNRLFSGKTTFGGGLYTSFAPGTQLPGDLRWETTEQTNFGLDAGFLDNRLRLVVDYYNKLTTDLLNTVPLPSSLGFTSTLQNVGSIKNNGVEFTLNADILTGDLKWKVDGNITFNHSSVEKLYDGKDIFGTSYNVTLMNDPINILREGEAVGAFYGYIETDYDETGRLQYLDLNEDGLINQDDKVITGNPNPDFFYGVNSFLSYKNFEFTFFLQGVNGNDIFNLGGLNNRLDVGFGGNMPKDVYEDHWTPETPNAKYPVPSATNQVRASNRFIEDGSYLRLRNIELGYNLPVEKWEMKSVRNVFIYASGQNLLTITNYSWWDPEVNSKGGSNSINQGIDQHTYPVAKSITFGIRAGF